MKWREAGELRWLEASLPSASVCFSTRTGGTSKAPFESLNLGILTDDERIAVLMNRRRLASALGVDGSRVAMARQVHGAEICFHEDGQVRPHFLEPGEPPPDADGHLTQAPGLPMLVLVADCLPVAMTGPEGLAMLHCGWRGLAAGIIGDAAGRIGATDAVIGPGIGPCCFEVGEEVFEAFSDLGPGLRRDRNLDLWKVARRQLERAGLERVETAGICTYCDERNFFSHRRDHGETGRQAGIAWID
ncbi:MAG: laccase domain-containing protein [Solirubrobacterales bacterium]|nr:laccase domain-containing protein [Solirubrobacterales bacterium]